ncbi:MAG: hypothetical protein ACF8PN_00675 [Phycisphaerales bacterium]
MQVPWSLRLRSWRRLGRLLWCLLILGGVATHDAPAQEPEGEVGIEVERFGLGDLVRPGSYAAIRVNLTYFGGAARPVLLAWDMPDGDGDTAAISRELTLNPGLRNATWIYVPLRYSIEPGQTWTVHVYELDEDRNIGAELAVERFRLRNMLEPEDAAIGVVGLRAANLQDYQLGSASQVTSHPLTTHEFIQVVNGLAIEDLPDRWMGYEMFETLVWTPEADPTQLGIDAGDAIGEWIYRGGHFVIILPEVGMPWLGSALDPVTPIGRGELLAQKWENVVLRDDETSGGLLRHLSSLTKVSAATQGPEYPILTLNVMRPTDGRTWSDIDAAPLMEIEAPAPGGGTERRAIVVQQHYGHGFVTIIGAPITSPQMNRPGLDLPEPEIFWNQILARRVDTPGPLEVDDLRQNNRLYSIRDTFQIDDAISNMIKLAPQAARGVLLALFFFAVYWIVAGPGSFAFLRLRGLARHSWVAFVGLALVFTVVSWTAARSFRSTDIRPIHVTVLDHVAENEWARATTWFTVALDGYGRQEVRTVADDGDGVYPWHDTMHTFTTPGEQTQGFPDRRTYFVPARDQSSLDLPARSTAKSLTTRSLFRLPEDWSMPNFTTGAEPRVVNGQLVGELAHGLPRALRNVSIYYVENRWYSADTERPGGFVGREPRIETRVDGRMRLRAYALTLASWSPGEVLDLGSLRFGNSLVSLGKDGTFSVDRLAKDLRSFKDFSGIGGANWNERLNALEALTYYRQIDPPTWIDFNESQPRFQRRLGRELDLSQWFNRPCVIITGFIDESPLPTPITVGGERLRDADPGSVTFVRYIYPLPVEEEPRV